MAVNVGSVSCMTRKFDFTISQTWRPKKWLKMVVELGGCLIFYLLAGTNKI
jgi:hypothetical protein